MKFSCYKKDLIEALQFAIKAVAVKPMTPVLAGIYLKAEGSMLELQANNYSTGIIVKIPVNTESPGEAVVGGKRFYEFMRNIPGETITFSDGDSSNTLHIEAGGAKMDLITMAAEDFPKVKKAQGEYTFSVDTTVLRNLIRKTIFAVSKEETRPIFTGCAFEIKNDTITLIATDMHRLSIASDKLIENAADCKFIVPAETLLGLQQRLVQNIGDKTVNMDYATRYLTFSFDNVSMTSRLIEGEFPPYDRVIPSSTATTTYVECKNFQDTLNFIALMSRETEYNTIKLAFSNGDGDGNLEISANSEEGETADKNLAIDMEGNDVEIAFNVHYVSDVLKVIESPKVNISLNDSLSPAVFKDPENENYLYVVTPVRAG